MTTEQIVVMSGNYTTTRLYRNNPGYPDRHRIDPNPNPSPSPSPSPSPNPNPNLILTLTPTLTRHGIDPDTPIVEAGMLLNITLPWLATLQRRAPNASDVHAKIDRTEYVTTNGVIVHQASARVRAGVRVGLRLGSRSGLVGGIVHQERMMWTHPSPCQAEP